MMGCFEQIDEATEECAAWTNNYAGVMYVPHKGLEVALLKAFQARPAREHTLQASQFLLQQAGDHSFCVQLDAQKGETCCWAFMLVNWHIHGQGMTTCEPQHIHVHVRWGLQYVGKCVRDRVYVGRAWTRVGED